MNHVIYPLRFASCRDTGHSWNYVEWNGSRRVLVCENCRTVRKDKMNSLQSITGREYAYPKNYQQKSKEGEKLSVAEFRSLLRVRLFKEANKLERWNFNGKKLVERRSDGTKQKEARRSKPSTRKERVRVRGVQSITRGETKTADVVR